MPQHVIKEVTSKAMMIFLKTMTSIAKLGNLVCDFVTSSILYSIARYLERVLSGLPFAITVARLLCSNPGPSSDVLARCPSMLYHYPIGSCCSEVVILFLEGTCIRIVHSSPCTGVFAYCWIVSIARVTM